MASDSPYANGSDASHASICPARHGGADDPAEREADAVADAVGSGSLARISIAPHEAVVRRAPAKNHTQATAAANQPLPTWTEPEIKLIQAQLIRLGLYRATADGDLGPGTQSGLVEAFGSDEWRTMDGATCLGKLKVAKAPAPAGSNRGQHQLRFGEMSRTESST